MSARQYWQIWHKNHLITIGMILDYRCSYQGGRQRERSLMRAAQPPSTSALFGSWERTSVSRALAELQALRPVQINAPGETLFVLPVEGLNDQRLAEFVSLCRPQIPHLII